MTRHISEHVAHALRMDRCIVIYPEGDKTAIDWIGLSADQVVRTLYNLADDVLRKRVPVDKPDAPEGPKRG